MITLMIDFDAEIGFWYFVVREGETVLHFRPGFRTHAEAEAAGDAWIRDELGAAPADEV